MNTKGWLNVAFLLPALFLFTVITYYPLVSSLQYSLTDWNMTAKGLHYIGNANYKQMLSDDLVLAGFRNTIIFTIYTTFIGNALALGLALVLDAKLKTKHYLRAVFYIPCLLSAMVVSAVFNDILQYHGILNELMLQFGLKDWTVDWFGNIKTALPMLIVLNAWQWMGYGSVIYVAGLQAIPAELYEAARIDGAGKVTVFRKVTFPLLMPSITIMTFMSITGGLKLFDIPYVLTHGGPGDATQTMGTVIYDIAFQHQKFGYATAISVVFFIVIAITSIIQVSFTRRREVHL